MRSILIADDHEVTRRGLREMLRDAFSDVEIAEAKDADGVRARLQSSPWDLITLDVMMPGSNLVALLEEIKKSRPETAVLVLTAATEIEYVIQALRAGANGLVHKHRAADDLLEAIQTVARGDTYLHPETAAALATTVRTPEPSLPHHKLSERELEIFRLIALGRAVKEIAGDLGLSDKTVATYLARIREKTGLTSHVEIARYALLNRVVD